MRTREDMRIKGTARLMTHAKEEHRNHRIISMNLRYMGYMYGRNTKDENFLNPHLCILFFDR
jgi:hypothetical protein